MTQSTPTERSAPQPIRVTRDADGVATVHVEGEIDIQVGPHLAAAISSAAGLQPTPSTVVVDLTDVPFLDSSALGELLAASRRLAESDIAFRVVIPADAPTRRVVELVGLVEVLNVTEPEPGADD